MKKRLSLALAAGALVAAMAPGVASADHGGKHVPVPAQAASGLCGSLDHFPEPQPADAATQHWAYVQPLGGC